MIWLNTTRAVLRVDEHREHYASDPGLAGDPLQSDETFLDVGREGFGTEHFTEASSQTVTKAQARLQSV